MNTALWIITAVLATLFLASGAVKLLRSDQQLATSGMGFVEDFPPGTAKVIGALEVLAAIGLVLPALLGVAPVLAPLAAVGLVLLMAGAVVTHVRRHESPGIVVGLVLLALAAVVAWGRFTG